ncbi:glycerophosphodiester phosphodiesterase [Neiella marina]|uniref:glycerophosphodiester phosphodiesterase n=1 Tax=Neiella holothuriorum TaxID=2870530 RepID=A0ABS7EIK2_9GAMM|nr:glycerophosphodiester phosphodiesterase [Neiella holothuriorum]MBW8192074.1 glycerophosphodiester phosphodiesterase [Neiella holothuriorum]
MKFSIRLLILAWLTLLAPCFAADVIAHRGASGQLPEHSLVATAYAHASGADYIEQDVVLSRDGVPIVLHDIELDTTTNVAEIFPKRARPDGRYYAIDFDLAELKTLELHERIKTKTGQPVYPQRFPVQHIGLRIPTLAEQITLIQGLNKSTTTNVGIYPEIKAPAWHRAQGQDISAIVLKTLADFGYSKRSHGAYLQCFDAKETLRIRTELGSDLKLVQLIAENAWRESDTDYDWLKTADGLKHVASYADGIGPWWPQVINDQQQASTLLKHAQQLGLVVHPYTFRADDLPPWADSYQHWLAQYLQTLGVDGVFTDFPMQTRLIIMNLYRSRLEPYESRLSSE